MTTDKKGIIKLHKNSLSNTSTFTCVCMSKICLTGWVFPTAQTVAFLVCQNDTACLLSVTGSMMSSCGDRSVQVVVYLL